MSLDEYINKIEERDFETIVLSKNDTLELLNNFKKLIEYSHEIISSNLEK